MFVKDSFIQSFLTSYHDDDDCELTVRCNGKLFLLRVSPTQIHASPEVSEYYYKCLKVLKSGEEVVDDVFDDEALEWLARPFEQMMAEYAPELPAGLGAPTLAQYYLPDIFVFTLDVDHNTFRPRRIVPKKCQWYPWVHLPNESEDLSVWTKVYSPSEVKIDYDCSRDVLNRPPRRVHVNDGKDAYFFKPFSPGSAYAHISHELMAFKNIAMANLDPKARICGLHGIVGEGDPLLGMLLTLVDERLPLSRARWSARAQLKLQWATQVEESVNELHKAGLVWGDVKPDNVLVDKQDNAWLVDFGGGDTEGWVDKDKSGTVKGDIQGLARIQEYLSK